MTALVDEFPTTPAAVPFTPNTSGVTETTLGNGVKVVSQETGKPSSTVGVAVAAGSRYASVFDAGAALVLKNMAFKSTNMRSDIKLAREIEAAGCSAASAGSRETILYTVSGTKASLSVAMEAVAETVLTPKLATWEVKDIIGSLVAKELAAAGTDPTALLSETLHEAAYGVDSPLGTPYYASPAKLSSSSLEGYMASLYVPSAMTVVGSGVAHSDLVAEAESLFGGLSASSPVPVPASPYKGGVTSLKAESAFTHVALAFPSADAATGAVLKELLSFNGSDMTSSFALNYSDGGIVGVMGAASPDDALAMVSSFVDAYKAAASVDEATFALAKTAAKTSALVGLEDSVASTLSMPDIDGVTSSSLKAAVAKALKAPPTLASVGPNGSVPTYPQLTAML